MKTFRYVLLIFLAFVLCSLPAHAKWWIFGQSSEDLNIDYLYLNETSFNELDTEVTLYKDMLPNGLISLKGKASVRKGSIGSVRISFDDKATWVKAKLSKGGAFEYNFVPEIEKNYSLYVEVMDTAGKKNDVEATHKLLVVNEKSATELVKKALDNLIDAYQGADPERFRSYVSNNFAGDATLLDRAIRKDFSAFNNIELRYSISNIIADATMKIRITINYARRVTSNKDGKNYTDNGETELVFRAEGTELKLFSLKNPLIFGLSDPSVASGSILGLGGKTIITVDDNGNVATTTGGGGTGGGTGGGGTSSPAISGTVTLTNQWFAHNLQSFSFDSQTTNTETSLPVKVIVGDFAVYGGSSSPLYLKTGTQIRDLGPDSINNISSAPTSGYSAGTGISNSSGIIPVNGYCYAFQLAAGKYAVIEVTDHSGNSSTGAENFTFKYKYQPNGTTNL